MQTKDGHSGRQRPKPLPAPWIEPDSEQDTQHFGSDPVPLDELDRFLGWAA